MITVGHHCRILCCVGTGLLLCLWGSLAAAWAQGVPPAINAKIQKSPLKPILVSDYGRDLEEQTTIRVYEQAAKAVVTLNAWVEGHPSSGAGVVIDAEGFILTSRHVVGDAKKVTIGLSDGRQYLGTVLATLSDYADLALVQIQEPMPKPPNGIVSKGKTPVIKGLVPLLPPLLPTFETLPLGDAAQIKVGQKVLAIGNPYGFERTLTQGIVSRIDGTRHRLQTDAAINPGNSGGPLLNRAGAVIGINQSIYNPDGDRSHIGIAFAVPITAAKPLIERYCHHAVLLGEMRDTLIPHVSGAYKPMPESSEGLTGGESPVSE